MIAGAIGAEFCRTLRIARSYWLEYVSDWFLYVLGFLLLITVFKAASPSYGQEGILSTLIGYTIWKISASVLVEIARIASGEARTGTLEQLFLFNLPVGSMFLLRSLGIAVNYALRGLILALTLGLILGILPPIPITAWLVFLLTLAGAGGLGFALAGLGLVYKRIGGMLQLLWQLLVFFTGALAPIQNSLFGIAAKALPLTWGIICLRSILVDGQTVSFLWQNGSLAGLLINSAFYLGVGMLLFDWGQRQARHLGVLGHY